MDFWEIKRIQITELVKKPIKSHQNMGCRMSVKLHFLYSHLDFFQVLVTSVRSMVRDFTWIMSQ